MSLPHIFIVGWSVSIQWLILITVLSLNVLQVPAFAFEGRQLLVEWHPATLRDEQSLIKSRVRIYQNKRQTANEDNRQDPGLPFSIAAINVMGWPFQTGTDRGDSGDVLYGGFYPEDHHGGDYRPAFQPNFGQSDFTLTLLPVLRLSGDWQQYLSGHHWWHWITGEPDYDSGVTVLFRIDGASPIVVQIAPEEYPHMAEYLANPRALLVWLAPRINGRDALVQQLLTLMESMTAEVDEKPQEQPGKSAGRYFGPARYTGRCGTGTVLA